MSTAWRLASVASVWFLGASSAFAHPGHGQGSGDFGLLHYLGEPAHLAFVIPLVLIVALGARYAAGVVRGAASRRS